MSTDQGGARPTVERIVTKYLRFVEAGAVVDPDRDLISMGVDSMNAVNLLFDIETAFQIQFPDAMLTRETFRCVRTLTNAVDQLVRAVGRTSAT